MLNIYCLKLPYNIKLNMAAISMPQSRQRQLPPNKRHYCNSPASANPDVKSKSKKNKTTDSEEQSDEGITLKDVYNLITEMRVDIDEIV